MIVSRIDGGLGNQMFQYAYGLYLAQRHQTQLVLDLRAFEAGPQHRYILDRFQIDAQPLDANHLAKIPKRYRQANHNWLPDWLRFDLLARVKERPFGFAPKYLNSQDNVYLVGYWQSQKFFPEMRNELLAQFIPAEPLSDLSRRTIDRMRSTNSVAVHVRRGDYVTNSEAAKLYENLEIDYYLSCLHERAECGEGVEVFIYSNDLNWCREQFCLPWRTHFVDHAGNNAAHEDLVMMSNARCNIIANSTFSWWAAYLNTCDGHATFAPRRWFRLNTLDDSHIPCDGWTIGGAVRDQAKVA